MQELRRKVMGMKDNLGDEGMRSVINAAADFVAQSMAIQQHVRDEEVDKMVIALDAERAEELASSQRNQAEQEARRVALDAMIASSVENANQDRKEVQNEPELKRKAEAESLASSQEQAPKRAREDVTSAMLNVSLASSQGQHPQPQHEEDSQMSAAQVDNSQMSAAQVNKSDETKVDLSASSDSEDEGGAGRASGAATESESDTPASSRREEGENATIASGVAASRLEEEVKHDLESLRCAVPPTNLLVSIQEHKWVLSTIDETEHEVMLVMAERTLLLYLRTTQPENLYEPLTKDEVAKLLKALEVQYFAQVSPERKQVCSRICMHPCSSLFVSLLDGVKVVQFFNECSSIVAGHHGE